ncbi:bifunctional tetrahydrofolate synthase/dihydrofolate synthase [Methylovorus menthalis]|uniref:bifunctional tetrahydrofolate synthase/dihydrofolate synthase n=1 Tax=Methylovorus menthalis TaxID=1002227 RepID=UPI001E540A4A|nr:bifunctional tetrahydrofolate synthase/dihydrofolate synthase [Methylovorus menthalis]MCB4811564.1 bifunctional tetrahydrofolate synthase/dihydrofolate synthase [Methylovorus menthalis]
MTDLSTPPDTLQGWLQYIEALHPKSIAMGLERVQAVKQRLDLTPDFIVITVAGTNGKGSTCAMLEQIYLQAGYRVGCYTSPHILRYNERVRIMGREAADADLCDAFARVEAARGDTALTYFEFGTLAALCCFCQQALDVVILEVGLGGRLDAVNVVDPDVAIITSIDLDHMDYLGDNRESIGFEKAGVYRGNRPAICADASPPQSLLKHAETIKAELLCINRDFYCHAKSGRWQYKWAGYILHDLPLPALAGDFQLANASAVLTAIHSLHEQLPVSEQAVHAGLQGVNLAGRFDVRQSTPWVVLDVAHNPHAAAALATNLKAQANAGRTLAVFAMLADKDIRGVVAAVHTAVHAWYLADITQVRGAKATQLQEAVSEIAPETTVHSYPNVAEAYRQACIDAGENDRIIVFGSFFTVADVMQLLPASPDNH